MTVWLLVDLSAVSLFCLTEVTPERHRSVCVPASLSEVMCVTSCAGLVLGSPGGAPGLEGRFCEPVSDGR